MMLLRRLSSPRDLDWSLSSRVSMGFALKAGVGIAFHDLTYTVVWKGGSEKQLQILKGVSGSCQSGRVLVIMGASGAGKTTLVRGNLRCRCTHSERTG